MKKFGHAILITGILLALTSCGLLPASTVKTLYLDHYLTECVGLSLRLCYLEKEEVNDTWTYRYSGIAGFEYEWGYTYKLQVRQTQIRNPPTDGSSIRTTLLEVISKEKIAPDVRFEIELTTQESSDEFAEEYLVQKAANLFQFHRVKEFTCSEAVCAELGSLLNENLKVTLEFTHPENSNEPLIAQRIIDTEVIPDDY